MQTGKSRADTEATCKQRSHVQAQSRQRPLASLTSCVASAGSWYIATLFVLRPPINERTLEMTVSVRLTQAMVFTLGSCPLEPSTTKQPGTCSHSTARDRGLAIVRTIQLIKIKLKALIWKWYMGYSWVLINTSNTYPMHAEPYIRL